MFRKSREWSGRSPRPAARFAVLFLAIGISALLSGANPATPSDPPAKKEYEILNDKSAALNGRGRFAQALSEAEKAIALNPRYSFAWNNKCVALIGLGRHDEALEAADRALEADPLNAVAWTNKALAYRQMQRLDDALKAMERAVLIDANNPLIWYNKACYHAINKDRAGALESLARAIEQNPKLKPLAAKESDFDALKEDPEFKKLVRK